MNSEEPEERKFFRIPKNITENDIYVTKKTSFAYQIQKMKKLLDQKTDCIRLHATGVSIPRAVALADTIHEHMGDTVAVDAATTTVTHLSHGEEEDIAEHSLTKIVIRITRVTDIVSAVV